jgi:hypothetical protein
MGMWADLQTNPLYSHFHAEHGNQKSFDTETRSRRVF